MMNLLVLASGSPRRKDLLSALDLDFTVQEHPFKETFPEDLKKGSEIAEYLAEQKAKQIGLKVVNTIYLTADTIVLTSEDKVLGKPKDKKQAIEFLESLSGKKHQVITGCCLSSSKKSILFSATTEVKFHTLSKKEIAYYIDTYEPYDKAGAYGIQEWIGKTSIKSINGSYFNVMGLPTDLVYQKIKEEFPALLKHTLK